MYFFLSFFLTGVFLSFFFSYRYIYLFIYYLFLTYRCVSYRCVSYRYISFFLSSRYISFFLSFFPVYFFLSFFLTGIFLSFFLTGRDVFSRGEVGIPTLIGLQALVQLPLACVRNVEGFEVTNLSADVCILVSVLIILYLSCANFRARNVDEIAMLNENRFMLSIGTFAFAFEGVALIIPLQEAMRDEEKDTFPGIFKYTVVGVGVFYVLFATLNVVAIGSSNMQTIVFLSYPTNVNGGNAVLGIELLYSIAALFTFPLQLFPATRIVARYGIMCNP